MNMIFITVDCYQITVLVKDFNRNLTTTKNGEKIENFHFLRHEELKKLDQKQSMQKVSAHIQ